MTRSTSIDAFRQINEEGLLSDLRLTVYNALYHHGPCTANELVYQLNQRGLGNDSRDFYAQRLSELRDFGVANELPKRKCAITGRNAIVWKTNNGLPIKPRKKRNKDQEIKRLQSVIRMIWKHKDCTAEMRRDINGKLDER